MSDDAITLHSDIELPSFLLKAGEAITRGDHYFRDVLESLPAAIYTTDAAGRITYYNEALLHCCGGIVRNWGKS